MSELGRIDAQEIPPEVVQLLASRAQLDPSRVRTIVLESGIAATEDRWISIPDAAARYSLHPAILLKLARDGVIRANRAVRKPEETLLLESDVRDVAQQIAEGVKEDEEGTITATEASNLCGVSLPTILSWAKRGHIRRAGEDPEDRRKVLLKRRDVDLAAVLVKLCGVARGRYVFPPGFTPT